MHVDDAKLCNNAKAVVYVNVWQTIHFPVAELAVHLRLACLPAARSGAPEIRWLLC